MSTFAMTSLFFPSTGDLEAEALAIVWSALSSFAAWEVEASVIGVQLFWLLIWTCFVIGTGDNLLLRDKVKFVLDPLRLRHLVTHDKVCN